MKPEQRVPINLYGIRMTAYNALPRRLTARRVVGSSSRMWRQAWTDLRFSHNPTFRIRELCEEPR